MTFARLRVAASGTVVGTTVRSALYLVHRGGLRFAKAKKLAIAAPHDLAGISVSFPVRDSPRGRRLPAGQMPQTGRFRFIQLFPGWRI